MLDKAFVVLLIFFMITGIYAYERFSRDSGEVSPISQVVDFANFSKFDPITGTTVKNSHEVIDFQSDSNLARLREKHNELHEERIQLINKRKEILQRLNELNGELEVESTIYAQLMDAVKQKFLQHFSQFNQAGQDLVAAKEIADPLARQTEYNRIKNDFFQFLAGIVPDPQADLSRLVEIFAKLEEVLAQEKDSILEGCGTLAECVQARIDELETVVTEMVSKVVDHPQRDITKINELLALLRREYQIQFDRTEASGIELKESSQQINTEYKTLVEELDDVTEKDFVQLAQMQDRFENEERYYTDFLERQVENLKWQQESVERRMSIIFSRSGQKPFADVNRFRNKMRYVQQEQKSLLRQAQDHSKRLTQIMHDQAVWNRQFMEEAARNTKIDLDNIMIQKKHFIKSNQMRQQMMNSSIRKSGQANLNQDIQSKTTQMKLDLQKKF
jgi:hypothetical protein